MRKSGITTGRFTLLVSAGTARRRRAAAALRRSVGIALVAAAFVSNSCSRDPRPPYSPSDALDSFEIHPDFAIELFASEPEIRDPVAMAFGPDGRIWVVENSGYPLDSAGGRGRVKQLIDRDGDGLPDSATVFAEGLTMPTGVMAWKDGVIVTDAPDVLYLADRDGDGRSDERVRLLGGFAFTNPQHTVSSPVYGLDNWIYLAHEGAIQSIVFETEFGDRGSEIHFPGRPGAPRLPVERRCLRFRPGTSAIEYLAGASQYGIAFSEWGDVLTHNNTYHSRHEVIASRYLQRNPGLRVRSTAHNAYENPSEPASVYPITIAPRFELLSGIGQMTSASGLTRYLGGAFPGYDDLAFVGESVHNVVHADRWSVSGSTFVARPVSEGREFLGSRDAWFRPVFFAVGPDGALYVVDYYRRVIEHPEWTSSETYESERLYDGDDLGRIWRITPKGGLPFRSPRLDRAPSGDLAGLLGSPNYWDRITAQELLVGRQDREAVPQVADLAEDDSNPLGRLHALWTLDGMGELADDVVRQAFRSENAGVRKNAIQLAERRFRFRPSQWLADLLDLERDASPHVRLQLLLTLGEAPLSSLAPVRERMLLADLEDEWFHTAALTWPSPPPAELLKRVAGRLDKSTPAEGLLELIAASVGGDRDEVAGMVAGLPSWRDGWRQSAVLRGLRTAVTRTPSLRRVPDDARERLLSLLASSDPEVRRTTLDLMESIGLPQTGATRLALGRATRTMLDPAAPERRRAAAIRLVALAGEPGDVNQFRSLIQPGEPPSVQAAAVAGLASGDAVDLPAFLLDRWSALPREARTVAAEALTARPDFAEALVVALEAGSVMPWTLEFRSKRRLLMHRDPQLRRRARGVLTESERELDEVIGRYRNALAQQPGDPARGRLVFERDCQECHRLGGQGKEVGPDLGTVRTRPALNLLHDILLPSASISQTYEAYVIELTDGELIEGVLGEQQAGFVMLRREGGEEVAVDRSRIASMRIAQVSAMPSDFDSRVTPSEMADLIRYIQTAPAVSKR